MSTRFELTDHDGILSIVDTERGQQFIGGVGRDREVANHLVDVANRLGDEAHDENVWIANAYDDPTRAHGKTPEYWEQFKR